VARAGSGSHVGISQLVRLGLFLGGSLLALAVFLLAHWAIARLSREVATTSKLLAQFCATASFPAARDPELRLIVTRTVKNIDFPIVLTDRDGLPRAWKGVGVDAALVSPESLDSLEAHQAIAPVIAERVERVRERVRELDHENVPIPMTRYVMPDTIGFVHYGEPEVLGVLRWTPIVALGGTVLLLGLGFWGLALIQQSERRALWVGMAKETAHQLGTPLSSLMGWNEVLRSHLPAPGETEARIPVAMFREVLGEMERDVGRLRKVADRFSNVGSEPRLQPRDPSEVVREVVGYMRRRAPQGGVELRERYESVPAVQLNAELLEWALENLISNALSAIDKRPGIIDVVVRPWPDGGAVEIAIADNGRGMTPSEQRRAFEPGYTTRRRGWGLGLPLARRVVEDYHGGRLWIRTSVPGEGTIVVLRLPAGV
jgi:signal transduction histidine kinase